MFYSKYAGKADILKELTYLCVTFTVQEANAFCQCYIYVEPCFATCLDNLDDA